MNMRRVLHMSRVPRSACPMLRFGAPRSRSLIWKPSLPGANVSASSLGVDPEVDRQRAIEFVRDRGHAQPIAAAVVAELESPEWAASSSGGLLALATRLAGRWEVGEDAGLGPLVAAVERAQAVSQGRARVSFSVRPARGAAFGCTGYEGMSLKEVAEHAEDEGASTLAEHLECACSGVMACSTCHIYVDSEWVEAVGRPTEEEEDMLDLAWGLTDTSRLGCQIKVTPEMEGMMVTIPDETVDLQ